MEAHAFLKQVALDPEQHRQNPRLRPRVHGSATACAKRWLKRGMGWGRKPLRPQNVAVKEALASQDHSPGS